MSGPILAEGIYVKRSVSELGRGNTLREVVLETLWYPHRISNGLVELYPVMDNLQSVLNIRELIPAELFEKEYSVKEDSREIYLRLKATLA
ncbi:MAG: hypothetical protein HZA16_10950 [Nitrospirae bacterium]|nr:hypothetical protein [Nitrospirota bacterium]